MYKFENLVFTKKSGSSGVEAFMLFPNSLMILVYGGGKEHYGDGVNTFEVRSPLHKDPLVNMKPDDITLEMQAIRNTKYNTEY